MRIIRMVTLVVALLIPAAGGHMLSHAILRYRHDFSLYTRASALQYNILGVAYERKHQYRFAEDAFSQAISRDPHSSVSYFNLGWLYRAWGRNAMAIPYLRRALELQPRDVKIRMILGNALRDTGQFKDAFTEYQTAEATNPSYGWTYLNYGAALLDRHDDVAAEWQYHRGLEQSNVAMLDADLHLSLGQLLLDHKRIQEAISELKRALIYDSSDPDIYTRLGEAYSDLHDWRSAAVEDGHAASLRPDDSNIHHDLFVDEANGNSEDFINDLQTKIQRNPRDAADASELGEVYYERGDFTNSRRYYEKAARYGDKETAQFARGRLKLMADHEKGPK